MYATFLNHAVNMSKYMAAFIFLFFILPVYMFRKSDDDKADNFVSGYIRMALFIILTGYILVITKLFEFLSLTSSIVFVIFLNRAYLNRIIGVRVGGKASLIVLNTLEGKNNLFLLIKQYVSLFLRNTFGAVGEYLKNTTNIAFIILFAFVLLYSAYLRFYDAFFHAAPPLSDAYTTLHWMKKIGSRVLFFEDGGGIYPRGLSIFLETLHKFTFIDELYILKYTGPLNSLLICIGIFFGVTRLSGKKYAGLFAMSLYGLVGFLFGASWERHASTNSQEFALVFVLPAIYFTYKYIKNKRKQDLFTAAAGISVIGLAHSLIFAYTLMCVGIVIIYSFLVNYKKNRVEASLTIAGCFVSVVIAVFPLAVGKLGGISLHGSSADFLLSSGSFALKKLTEPDIIAVVSICIMVLFTLLTFRKNKKEINAYSISALTGLAIFLIYFAGGAVTKSVMLSSRTSEMWAVFSTVCAGMGISVLLNAFSTPKAVNAVGILACIVSITILTLYFRPPVIIPYKMEWDSGVEQYLRIRDLYKPKTWLLAAQKEQFSIAYGTGFHIYADSFIKNYVPESYLDPIWSILSENIFIYQPKNVFRVTVESGIYDLEKPIYEKREEEKKMIQDWLDRYSLSGGGYDVFFEDNNLRIIHIKNIAAVNSENGKIWGE